MSNNTELQSIAGNLKSLCGSLSTAAKVKQITPVKTTRRKPGSVADPNYDARSAQKFRMQKTRAEKLYALDINYLKQNPRRIKKGEGDPKYFLHTYYPHIFYRPFSIDQEKNVCAIASLMQQGGLKAIAAPRGDGKTSILKGMCIWGVVHNIVSWVMWAEVNKKIAEKALRDMKLYLRLIKGDDLIGQDFPQYCVPIRSTGRSSQKANALTYEGKNIELTVNTDELVLPTINVEGMSEIKKAFGGRLQACSLEAARGQNEQGNRPDIIVFNDIENETSAKSITQTEANKDHVIKTGLGLGGPGEKMGAIALCTLISEKCLAAQLTDISMHPEWQGVRQKLLGQWPTNTEMWEKYISLRKTEQRKNAREELGLMVFRNADEYYRKNQKEMDLGATVNNPYRYRKDKALDGKPFELSAHQHCFNLIADRGMSYFLTECQNEPPKDISDVYEIENHTIEEKVNGLAQGVIPAWAEKVTVYVDVHDTKLYWTALATKQGFNGYVFDYGVERVFSPISGSTTKKERQKQVDIAITEALVAFDKKIRPGWEVENSDIRRSKDIGLVDAGYKDTAVYKFVRKCSGWLPAKGGASRSGNYTVPKPSATIKNIGEGFHFSYIGAKRIWLLIVDPNKWKKHTQDSFLVSDIDADGSLSLFGDDPVKHKAFAEHIVSEAYNTQKQKFEPVKGLRHNHWLDSTSGCCVAAAVLGIELLSPDDVIPEENDAEVNSNGKPNGIRTKY